MKNSKNSFSLIRMYLFILLFLTGGIMHASLPKILLVAADDDSYILDVQAKLTATGMFSVIDMFNTRSATPNIATLKKYNAILVWTNYHPTDEELLGDNLAAYIEDGGGVVDAVFDNASIPILGDFDSSVYRCLVPLSQVSGFVRTMDSIILPDHPVMKNVLSFNAGTDSFISSSDSVISGSYIIALYDNDAICIAAKENVGSAKTRRVSLNFFPPSSDLYSTYWDASTDGALIMANALAWVANQHNSLPKVLVAGAESNDDRPIDVRVKLLSTGLFSEVDIFNTYDSTPSLSVLNNYKAVLVWTDNDPENDSILSDNLADYIDGGGTVVDALWSFDSEYGILRGRFNQPEYLCLNMGDYTSGIVRTLGTVETPGHAIMVGVNSFNGGSSSFHSTINSVATDAYIVARYDNNDILVAARENVGPANARRVSLNFWPVSSSLYSGAWNTSTDAARIMANALLWGIDTNNCLNFDGVNDYITTNINPDESASFTYMASVFPVPTGDERMIVGTCDDVHIWTGFWLEINSSNRLSFYADHSMVSDDILPEYTWNHVAVTYDTLSVKLYINGLLQAEDNTYDIADLENGLLHIGAIGSGDLSQYLFGGNIDNMSIWNKALTPSEILRYQNRKLAGNETGLVAYYDFNQGTAGGDNPGETILLDRKTSAYNGELHNFALTGGASNWVGSVAFTDNNIPSGQAKNVTFGNVSEGQVEVSWTRGSGDKCAVFVKNASFGAASPVFETSYADDPDFGEGSQIRTSGWYCAFNGTGSGVTLRNLADGETYLVHVCEYTGTPGAEDYNFDTDVNNPASVTITGVSINVTSNTSEIRVYPNPVGNYLTIESNVTTVLHYSLCDLSGKVLLTGTLDSKNLDMSNLKPGMYLLEINHTNKFKIVKQ